MPKTKISEWSSTPASNTDIDGINIAEGCAPSGINDAIREMMAQVKDLYSGTTGDAIGIAGGGTGAITASGARTNLGAQDILVSGTNIKTINSTSILGAGNLVVGVSDGDKGDITVSGSGANWTVDNGAITTAKIADANVTGAKLENSGVTAGVYGSASAIPVVTVDAKGRVTSATTAALGGGGFSNMVVFTSSGTWTVPAGVSKAKVTVVGGGGGSMYTAGCTDFSGGSGATSSFGAFCSATGGQGELLPAARGAGGIGAGGSLNLRGGSQADGSTFLGKPGVKGDNGVFYQTPDFGAGGSLRINGASQGSGGGTAIGIYNVSGSVAVTIGAGGSSGPGGQVGAPGIVIIEY